MPFSLSDTKARFGRAIDRFKRKISVTEITEAPHPSIDDFLAYRNQDQGTDDGNGLRMCQCSTCQKELQPQGGNPSNIAAERVGSIMMSTPGPGISQVSLVFVTRDALSGLPSMPAKHTSARRRSSANTSVTTFQFNEERRTSKDTVMASPSALVQAFRDCIPTHPALVDLPPPFSRHSDPTYREGPAKRAEIRRQASQRALQRRCSILDDEADKLAARLEETEKQLSDARQELESVLDELAVREDVNRDLRQQCSQKEKSITYWKHQHDTLARDLSILQGQLDQCTEQKLLDRDMIQSLLKCRRHRHCKLRYDVLHLSEQLNAAVSKLQDLKDIRYEYDLLQCEMRGLEDKQAENEELEVQLQESQAQNEVLKGEVQDLWNQRTSDEDIEATQLAEREVFVMHERLRMAERELKLRRTSLEVVRQNNRHLGAEIACLRLRLVDQERKDVRRTV